MESASKTSGYRDNCRSPLNCYFARRNHTNLIIDKRAPKIPPETTFNAVKDAGAEMTPSQPESPISFPHWYQSLSSRPRPLAPIRPESKFAGTHGVLLGGFQLGTSRFHRR
jgi:hypothetical protein